MPQTQCEFCSSTTDLSNLSIPTDASGHATSATVCSPCKIQIESPSEINAQHWYCLKESIWSENPAVKITAWKILTQLASESWALDLRDQIYLEDDVLDWLKSSTAEKTQDSSAAPQPRDSNGAMLLEGDSVTLIKDLDVKGANFTAKRGTLVKGIKVGDDPDLVEGRVNGIQIFLKTCFLKKAT